MSKMNLPALLVLLPALALPLATAAARAAEKPAATQPAAPSAPSAAELSRQRVEAAAHAMKLAEQLVRNGTGKVEDLDLWMQRWLQSRLEAAGGREERIAILKEYVGLAKAREKDAEMRMRAGLTSTLDAEGARYFRIDAELRLARRMGRADEGGAEAGAARPDRADRREQQDPQDQQALQGTWKVITRVKNGAPEDEGQPVYLKFAGKTVSQSRGEGKSEGTFTLDESKAPRRITLTGTSGEKAGSVFEAIYELEGNTLKLAYGTGDNAKTPPQDFSGGEGSGLLVLEKQKQ